MISYCHVSLFDHSAVPWGRTLASYWGILAAEYLCPFSLYGPSAVMADSKQA